MSKDTLNTNYLSVDSKQNSNKSDDPFTVILNKLGPGFFMILFVVANIVGAIISWNKAAALKQEEKISTLASKGTIIIAAGKTQDRSADLLKLCSEHAAISLLTVNPRGLSYETMFQAYTLDGVQEQRFKEIESDKNYFFENSIYQNVNIDLIEVETFKENTYYVTVTGQLLVNGKFKDSSFVYPETLTLYLRLVKNTKVGMNGYAPYAVSWYEIERKKTISAESVDAKLLETKEK